MLAIRAAGRRSSATANRVRNVLSGVAPDRFRLTIPISLGTSKCWRHSGPIPDRFPSGMVIAFGGILTPVHQIPKTRRTSLFRNAPCWNSSSANGAPEKAN